MTSKGSALLTWKFSFFFLVTVLLGCRGPTQSWEMTVQGAYTGAISRSGAVGFVGSIHHGGSFWKIPTHEKLYQWDHGKESKRGIYESAITSDGRFVVTAEGFNLVLWNTRTGQSLGFWQAPAKILSIALSVDGQFALLGLDNYTAVYFNVVQGGITHTFKHDGLVHAVALDEKKRYGLTAGDDQVAKLWALESGELVQSFEHTNQVKVVALSPSGRYALTSAHSDKTAIWNTENGRVKTKLDVTNARYTTASFSRSEKYVVTGNVLSEVQLWKITKSKALRRWKASRRSWSSSPNFEILAVGLSTKRKTLHAIAANGMAYQFKL